jgi:NAD(P)-dependent dehydrogenase (short-subunit alcohol dehydrogenase family)
MRFWLRALDKKVIDGGRRWIETDVSAHGRRRVSGREVLMKASELFDVRGKVIMVTGAASGLGRMIAETMADNGAHVVLADRDEAGLAAAVAELSGLSGQVESCLIDLSQPDRMVEIIDGVVDRLGRLDVMFANAGTSGGPGYANPVGCIDMLDGELWEQSTRINMMGAAFTLKAAAKPMKKQGSGSIVVTTSVAALSSSSLPGYAYFAAKAGIAQVVRVAANELAAFNVRVNGIAPGAFPTNMAGGRLKEAEAGAKFAALAPLKRIGQMHEIAGVALLLASDASSYMTGANIPVDGGVAAA